MQRWLTRDWGAKLGAVLLATALWFHAVTEHSYRRALDIPLLIEDPATPAGEASIVLSSAAPSFVRVAVVGTGKDLLRASVDDFLLRVQTPFGPPGRRLSLRLEPTQVESQSELDLYVQDVLAPTDVVVTLDHLQERRVPVRPLVGLRLAESYTQVGPTALDPDSVDVSGPVTHLREIAAIYTDSLFRDGVRDDVDVDLALQVPPGRQLSLGQDRVRVRIDVQELAEYPFLNVPVKVIGGPRGAVAEPSRVTVRVRGGADLIGTLDPENDLRLTVRYAAASDATGGLIEAPPEQLYEIRQIIPARATIVTR
jgi:hypothetical protein